MIWKRLFQPILFGLSALWTNHATAHPHVWLDHYATLVWDKEKLVAVKVDWTFDEFFTAIISDQFDLNKDQKFDAAEFEQVKLRAFDNLQGFSYFTHIWLDGQKINLPAPSQFTPSFVDQRIHYQFTIPLNPVVDPQKQEIRLGFYDETFYIDVGLDKDDPVRFEGNFGNCHFENAEDPANPIYYGTINPVITSIKCPSGS